tara:strand:- start:115 stop:342 length:228 start_codon:yes stop_codon:yes gene_type:complete
MKIDNLKMVIDSESLNIYLDNGEDKDPTHIIYWTQDEWMEDPETVVGAMLIAIDLFNNDMHEVLLKTIGHEVKTK